MPFFSRIKYLTLILTDECNLSCLYCYRDGKSKTSGVMDQDLAFGVIKEIAGNDNRFHIQLSGGDPTLYPEMIEKTASFVRNKGIKASLGIQTNGTLIDTSLAGVLKRYKIQTGVSLDGPLKIHEELRGRTKETLAGMKILSEMNIPFSVTTVITGNNIAGISKLPFILDFYKSCIGIGFDLLVQKKHLKEKSSLFQVTKEDLSKNLFLFVQSLAFVNKKRCRIRFRELDKLLKPASERFCHAANGTGIAMLPDGRFYPCTQTAGDSGFYLGKTDAILKTGGKSHGASGLTALPSDNNAMCLHCLLRGNCPLECPSRLHYNSDSGRYLSCLMYRTIYETAVQADILASGRQTKTMAL